MERSAAGTMDATSFRAFYERTLPHVYGYCFHRCGRHALAEDLTQETYAAAARAMEDGVTPSLPWLLTVARNKLVDELRRQDREARKLTGWWARRDPTNERGDVPDQDVRTVAALAAVPPSQRAALILHHVDGQPVAEVARLLRRSEPAVESLLARGRKSFRLHYRESDDE